MCFVESCTKRSLGRVGGSISYKCIGWVASFFSYVKGGLINTLKYSIWGPFVNGLCMNKYSLWIACVSQPFLIIHKQTGKIHNQTSKNESWYKLALKKNFSSFQRKFTLLVTPMH